MRRRKGNGLLTRRLVLSTIVAVLISGPLLGAAGRAQPAPPGGLLVRKNVLDLTAEEKADFVAAILELKETKSPYYDNLSWYDQFVYWHKQAFKCGLNAAHMTPAFLPWHRQFLLMFQEALSEVAGKPIALPYWDWTDPETTEVVFSDDFMGGNGNPKRGYAVTTGPFRKGRWYLNVVDPKVFDPYRFRHLVRRFGADKIGTKDPFVLPSPADLEAALSIENYDVAPYDVTSDPARSFRNNLEGWRGEAGMHCESGWMVPFGHSHEPHVMHNVVHLWVAGLWGPEASPHAGTMALNTSLNDPVFWLHHAMVDRTWWLWEQRHGQSYRPESGQPFGQNLNDPMWPYRTVGLDVAPAHVLDTEELGYTYDS